MPYSKTYRQQLIDRENKRINAKIEHAKPNYDFYQFYYQYETRKMHVSPPCQRRLPYVLQNSALGASQSRSPIPVPLNEAQQSRKFDYFYGRVNDALQTSTSPRGPCDLLSANSLQIVAQNLSSSSVNPYASSRFVHLEQDQKVYTYVGLADGLYYKESVFGFYNNNPAFPEQKRAHIGPDGELTGCTLEHALQASDHDSDGTEAVRGDEKDAAYKDSLNFARPGEESRHETDQLRTTEFDTQTSGRALYGQNNLRSVELGLGDAEDFD